MNFNYQTIQKSKDKNGKDIYKLPLTPNKYLYLKDDIIYDIKSYNSTDCNKDNEHKHEVTTLQKKYEIAENYPSEEAAKDKYKTLPFIITMELTNGKTVFVNLENYISNGWKINEKKEIWSACDKILFTYIKEKQENEITQDILNRRIIDTEEGKKLVKNLIPNLFLPIHNDKIDNIYGDSTVTSITIGTGGGAISSIDIDKLITKDKLINSMKDEAIASAKQTVYKTIALYGINKEDIDIKFNKEDISIID